MILIISAEDDITTNDVIKWLRYDQQTFLRVSASTRLELVQLELSPEGEMIIELEIEGRKINLDEVTAVWYRRSWFHLDAYKPQVENNYGIAQLVKQLGSETRMLTQFLLDKLDSQSLNTERTNELNKLSVIQKCNALGIQTPPSLVTTDKITALRFLETHDRIISKNASPGIFMDFEDHYLIAFTEEIKAADLEELPDRFAPMLFQKLIEKAFEIRTFYLDGAFFSSAIFSQNDAKTQIDFRNYNFEVPNRTPPYALPVALEKQLDALMKDLGLNSCSIDLIYTTQDEYVFLEVNPIGQFYQVSHPCNYYLEQKVARYLSQAII